MRTPWVASAIAISPPEGKRVIYAVMSSLPDPSLDPSPYLEYVEKTAKELVPALFERGHRPEGDHGTSIVSALGNDAFLPHQGGEACGIANLLGRSGPSRPDGSTSIKGLYVVGNDTAGFGLGTHQAVDSAFKVLELIRKKEWGDAENVRDI
jgi:phytoene dehydrogenase-like protein